MNLPESIPSTRGDINLLLGEISEKASNKEKNIIFLEILALIKSDGIYDDSEQDFMSLIARDIKIKNDTVDKITNLLEIYSDVISDIYQTIMG